MLGLPNHARRLLVAGGLVAAVAVPVASTPAQAFVTPAGTTISAASSPGHVSVATKKLGGVTSASARFKPTGAKKPPVKKKKRVVAYRVPSRIIATARKYDGGYYRYAGTTPRGFDCSGYTRYVFGKLGRSLPHNAAAQYTRVKHISRAHARAGDLIFFRSGSGHIYHVGIFAGHGRLYHASEPGRRTGLGTIFSSHVSFGRA